MGPATPVDVKGLPPGAASGASLLGGAAADGPVVPNPVQARKDFPPDRDCQVAPEVTRSPQCLFGAVDSPDRIVLLGDAAHPMLQYLAQGACQALEDAVALGDALGRVADPAEAFHAYADRRRERATRIQTNARRFGEICHLEGMGATLRTMLLSSRKADDFDDISWVWTPATAAVPAL